MTDCVLCRGTEADADLFRTEVWSDDLWRLTTATESEVAGFSYLEPRRHIPHVTDLDGPEAATLGPVLARVTTAIKQAAGAEVVYVYVFGDGVPHLHLHLAPHTEGDALNDSMIKGPVETVQRPDGITLVTSRDHPPRPPEEIADVTARLRRALAAPPATLGAPD